MTVAKRLSKPVKLKCPLEMRDRIWNMVVVFGVLALLMAIAVSAYRFQQGLDAHYRGIAETGKVIANDFDHEMEMQAFGVQAMAIKIDDVLAGRTRLVVDPVHHLVAVPERKGYSLDLPPAYNANEIGNLTGDGPLPRPGSSLASEVTMAFSLSTLFRAIQANSPDLPWVYYTSARHFIYLYPRVQDQQTFFSPELYKQAFYTGALPQNNPSRRIFWTPVYSDTAGKGLMVTVSKPVYQANRFLGSVSIDVSLKRLLTILHNEHIPHSAMHLVDAQGRDMLGGSAKPMLADVAKAPVASSFRKGDTVYTVYPVKQANWYIVLATDWHAMLFEVAQESAIGGIMLLLVLGSVILIVLLMRTMRELRTLSVRDGLTGLYNRRYFDEIGRREFARIQRGNGLLGLAIIDIDFFKKYNDHYGHQEGDKILRSVATEIRETLRRATDEVFRVGGEEFAVLIALERPEQLKPFMDEICDAVRTLAIPHVASNTGTVTISLGATAVSKDNWVDLDGAYKRADDALYRAKESGRNHAEVNLG